MYNEKDPSRITGIAHSATSHLSFDTFLSEILTFYFITRISLSFVCHINHAKIMTVTLAVTQNAPFTPRESY